MLNPDTDTHTEISKKILIVKSESLFAVMDWKLQVFVQEFVTLKCSSSQGQCKPGPSQEATGTGNVPQPGTPASSGDWRHADSVLSEEVHEQQAVTSQQAVLSQLKEVPIKSMNASLLVAPLLDHGNCVGAGAIAWLLAHHNAANAL